MSIKIYGQKVELNVPYTDVIYKPMDNTYLVRVYMIAENVETKRKFKRGFAIKIAAEMMYDIAEGNEFPVIGSDQFNDISKWEELIQELDDE